MVGFVIWKVGGATKGFGKGEWFIVRKLKVRSRGKTGKYK